jgi:beta-aspartyl-peptidase (threonine type)
MRARLAPALSLALSAGCALVLFATQGRAPEPPPPAWALAIHGGAGTPPRDMPEERKRAYLDALAAALADGRTRLEHGASALDVVEALVARLEDDPLFNAGRGAVFNAEGRHELDAAIMDGATLGCGAVAAVTTVRHPVTLARRVMERSGHVLLVGAGAERFADETGVERVPNEWFSTPERRAEFEKKRAEEEKKRSAAPGEHGTVGAVALDRAGHLAAATSTGGLTLKRWGRVGDVPIVGAGTYADDRTVAVSATGKGEEFIRHGVAREIAALVAHAGMTPEQAAKRLVLETLKPGDGGLIALGRDGSIVLVFNTEGMFRAAADANGRFETAIW